MIQRIQTIFLLLAAGGMGSLLALPFARTGSAVAASPLFSDAAFGITDHPALMALFLGAGALALIAIFQYKNRPLQTRLTIFSFIATFIGLILGALILMQDAIVVTDSQIDDSFGLYATGLSLVSNLLALRFIRKDESLVRSMDRLR